MHTFLGTVGALAVLAGLADPTIWMLVVVGVIIQCASYYIEGSN